MEPNETAPKKPNPPSDDSTILSLAAVAMDLHVATLLRDKNGVASQFLRIGILLRQNPGFAKRFREKMKKPG